MRAPECIQLQPVPQLTGQPTGAPLTRPTQLQPAQFDLHHRARQLWGRRSSGNRAIWAASARSSSNTAIEWHHAARWAHPPAGSATRPAAPPTHRPPGGSPPRSSNGVFALLVARLRLQEHADRVGKKVKRFNGLGRHCRHFQGIRSGTISHLPDFPPPKMSQNTPASGRIAEVGLASRETVHKSRTCLSG